MIRMLSDLHINKENQYYVRYDHTVAIFYAGE